MSAAGYHRPDRKTIGGPEDVAFKYRGRAVDFEGGSEGAQFDYEARV